MSIEGQNKQIGNDSFKTGSSLHTKATATPAELQKFYFPTLGVTVEAATLEEATKKANTIINN